MARSPGAIHGWPAKDFDGFRAVARGKTVAADEEGVVATRFAVDELISVGADQLGERGQRGSEVIRPVPAAVRVLGNHHLRCGPATGVVLTHQYARAAACSQDRPQDPVILVVDVDRQKIGLVVGLLIYGLTWGLLVGIGLYLTHGWVPSRWTLGRRGLLVAGLAGWSVALFPFLKYPANPPGVGEPETIGYRQTLYLGFIVLAVIGVMLAASLRRQLRGTAPGASAWILPLVVYAVCGDTVDHSQGSDRPLWAALDHLDRFYREAEQPGSGMRVVRSRGDLVDAHDGDVRFLLHFEGGSPLEGSTALLRAFYRLGLRSIQPVHNRRNQLGDGVAESATGGGLTRAGEADHEGREVVERERLHGSR